MTDRVKGLVVVLDANYREDDIQALCDAISLFTGVVQVDKVKTNPDDYINQQKIRNKILENIFKVINEETK